jgi:GrpB-like predicted nucleotidyltransferase (UPF0157 family)
VSDFEVVGGPSSNEPIELVPYDPSWPAQFDAIKARLVDALGATARRVDHVGSTAVPGLIAKPIIDAQLSVPDHADEDAFAPHIAALGWPLRARSPGERYFRPPNGAPRIVHLHVCDHGGEWERRHLLFRDYLRAHAERCASYSALKSELAEKYRDDRLAYVDGKTAFVEQTLADAAAWATSTGWTP